MEEAAKAIFRTAPSLTVFDRKDLIGRKFQDAELERNMKHWSFKSVNKAGKPIMPTTKIQVKQELENLVSAKLFSRITY